MKKLLFSIFAACLFALTFSVIPAAAAVSDNDMYLQLEGIHGESIVKGYDKWIGLKSAQYQIAGQFTAFDPSHAAQKASFDHFVFTKKFDSSSIPLMMNELKGTPVSKGKIAFVHPDGRGNPFAFLTIEFESVVVSSYSFDNTQETIALKFGKIQWTYYPIDSKGNPSNRPIKGGWDLEENKETSFPSTPTDKIAPVTKSTFTPVRSPNNKITALSVKLTATDNDSGVSKTEFRINDGEWTTYTVAFTVQAATAHNLEWRSIDKAGNVEKTWFADFDKGAPPRQI